MDSPGEIIRDARRRKGLSPEEVFRIADLVTVLRDGCHVATHAMGELDKDRLINLMVGRKGLLARPPSPPRFGPAVLAAFLLASIADACSALTKSLVHSISSACAVLTTRGRK